ncbi:MAG: molybdenum ABC transporter ATP-binding protein, partial [Burkholderiales bacterium]
PEGFAHSAAATAAEALRARFEWRRPGFELDVDLTLPGRGITALWGPSGSGKTTFLRCVAGLAKPANAYLSVRHTIWQNDSRGIFVPTHRRAIGMVFQEPSLFEHLDVGGNIVYGAKRVGRVAERMPIDHVIDLLGIGALLGRRPADLSGGERQRVAIARALAAAPELLLMDEPLAALDPARRQEVLPFLERLRDELHIPMLYVSHSADEVARLADTLVLLDRGKVLASGPVAETLSRIDVAPPLGEDAGVLLTGVLAARDERWQLSAVRLGQPASGRHGGHVLWLRDSGVALGAQVRVRVLARDVSIALKKPQASSIQNLLPCTVDAIADDPHPAQALVRLDLGNAWLLARLTRRAVHMLGLAPGMTVWAQVKSAAIAV